MLSLGGPLGLRTLPPAADVPEDSEDFPQRWLQAPVLSGMPLKLFVALAESPLAGPVRRSLLRSNGFPQVLEELFIPEHPTYEPNTSGWAAEAAERLAPLAADGGSGELSAAERAAAAFVLIGQAEAAAWGGSNGSLGGGGSGGGSSQRRYTVADFRAAYALGALTPLHVAENIIAAVEASEARVPPMQLFVSHDPAHLREAAAASAQRWAAGRPLSPLDGVPFAVKDLVDALPYPTTAGTAFLAEWRTPVCTMPGVQALIDAGALLVGKATLHEIGLGTTGLNLVTGTARNPHSTAHHTGGSSSGSAAAVAAGLCPFAVGSDGGGSIRIPSAACGVVGLKPTHGRVGMAEGVPPVDATVAVIGPIAGSVQDCCLAYALMANTGQNLGAVAPPPVMLPAALGGSGNSAGSGKPLAGMRAGICWKWFDDAAPAVADACRAAVQLMEADGLELVELAVPELGLLPAAHSCTITCEMRNNMQAVLLHAGTRRLMNTETRVSLAVAAGFEAAAYVQAQKIRTRIEAHFRRAFRSCDFLLTPTLPCTAPPIKPAALGCGETDLSTTTSMMRYMQAANFIGIPALTVPVAVVPSTHSQGGATGAPMLPVGLQIMAPCFHEASLLHVGAVLEKAVEAAGSGVPLPPVWYDVLKQRSASGSGGSC